MILAIPKSRTSSLTRSWESIDTPRATKMSLKRLRSVSVTGVFSPIRRHEGHSRRLSENRAVTDAPQKLRFPLDKGECPDRISFEPFSGVS